MKLITFFLFSNPTNLWDAEIVTIAKRIPVIGNLHRTGCMLCSVRKLNQIGYKTYQVHRFVWVCHNGLIPDGNYNWCHSNRRHGKKSWNLSHSLASIRWRNKGGGSFCKKLASHNFRRISEAGLEGSYFWGYMRQCRFLSGRSSHWVGSLSQLRVKSLKEWILLFGA